MGERKSVEHQCKHCSTVLTVGRKFWGKEIECPSCLNMISCEPHFPTPQKKPDQYLKYTPKPQQRVKKQRRTFKVDVDQESTFSSIFYILATGGLSFASYAITYACFSNSAIHEIEGLLCLIISAIALTQLMKFKCSGLLLSALLGLAILAGILFGVHAGKETKKKIDGLRNNINRLLNQ